eukprot:1141188-Pelagomonas_calceolata.AAC.4
MYPEAVAIESMYYPAVVSSTSSLYIIKTSSNCLPPCNGTLSSLHRADGRQQLLDSATSNNLLIQFQNTTPEALASALERMDRNILTVGVVFKSKALHLNPTWLVQLHDTRRVCAAVLERALKASHGGGCAGRDGRRVRAAVPECALKASHGGGCAGLDPESWQRYQQTGPCRDVCARAG